MAWSCLIAIRRNLEGDTAQRFRLALQKGLDRVRDVLRGAGGSPRGVLVPGEGFEPPTFGLQNRCTTTVLTRQALKSLRI
jgi:hypothetical protein